LNWPYRPEARDKAADPIAVSHIVSSKDLNEPPFLHVTR
jgi:hypothetical protein